MASSVIGNLRVNLGLDSASLQNGLRAAGGSMNKFAADMGRVAGAAAATLGPALAAIGVAAINSANDIQRLAQLSNATPEQFQEWAAASKTVGIEQDKLGDILKDVNDRVGDFVATGGGPMVDFFENIAPKVGVTADMFRDLSGPDALQLYIDSLQKAGVNQQDMTFYLEAMASDLTGLLPLLQNGGAGLDEYRKKARDLGVVMSNDTVASFASAKRSMEGVSMAMTGFRNIIAAEVVPYIKLAADTFVNAAMAGQPLGNFVRAFAEQIPRLSSYISTFVGLMGARWVAAFAAARLATLPLAGALTMLRGAIMRTGIGVLVVGAGELVYQFTNLMRATGGFGAALRALSGIATEVWGRIEDGAWALRLKLMSIGLNIQAEWAKVWAAITGGTADTSFLEERAGNLSDQADIAIKNLKRPLESVNAIRDAVGQAAAETTNLGSAFTGMGAGAAAATDKAKAKVSDLQRVMKRLKDDLAEATETQGMTEAQKAAWQAQREAGVEATSAAGMQISKLTEQTYAINQTKDAWGQMGQVANQTLGEILKKGANASEVIGNLLQSLSSTMLNAGLNTIWGSVSSNLSKSAGGTDFLKFLGIGSNANGTNHWRGGLSWVNERGGELMNLPKGTQIIPHDISKRMADRASAPGRIAQIVPSKYFDVVVDGRAEQVAGRMDGQMARAQTRAAPMLNADNSRRGIV